MRIIEIVGELAGAVVGEATTGVGSGIPDNWKKRADAFRRKEERRSKLAQKVRDAETKKYQQQRAASEKQFSTNDQIRKLQRDLADSA